MDCSGPQCQSRLKTLTGDLPPSCAAALTKFSGGFKDPWHCMKYLYYGNTASAICCQYPGMYDNGPDGRGGNPLFCENPLFTYSEDACRVQGDPFGPGQMTVCPKAGATDALLYAFAESRIAPNNCSGPFRAGNFCVWGFGADIPLVAYIFNGDFPSGPCFDGSEQQQKYHYTMTHEFCPNLPTNVSYSTSLRVALYGNQAVQGAFKAQEFQLADGLDAECCLRADQSNLTLPSGRQCHAMSCFESPICASILRDTRSLGNQTYFSAFCSQNEANFIACKSWTAWAVNSSETVLGTASSIPAVGANPSNFDQALFSILDYCRNFSSTDHETCDAIEEVGGGLLFPRLDVIHMSDIIQQWYVSDESPRNNLKSIVFQVTNMSTQLISSLSIEGNLTNYSFVIDNPTLLPFAQTNVTMTTNLAQPQSTFTYHLSVTTTFTTDAYNSDGNCNKVGFFSTRNYYDVNFSGVGANAFAQTPLPSSAYIFPTCLPGDNQVSNDSTTMFFSNSYLRRDDNTALCAAEGLGFGFTFCKGYYNGCKDLCQHAGDCGGWGNDCNDCSGFDSRCDYSFYSKAILTCGTSCSSFVSKNSPYFFYDSVKTNLSNNSELNYVVLGGFAASFDLNPMDLSLKTYQLVAYPLSGLNL